ncbi:class A sortase [Carnobacterium sp.]|uniref:class A sortase n=1 Tax=Carnobacterium sp. TaxID=48221 RepID=UPI0028A8FEB2|nr:class A sortase [Carnobacterium sp.]
MKKSTVIHLVSYLFLFIGTILLLVTPIKNYIVHHATNDLSLNQLSKEDVKSNQAASASFDFSKIEMLDFQSIVNARLNIDDINIVGGISVPSVGLNLPIGLGLSPSTLALTAGTMKENQVMGKGNYALAGHHMNRSDLLFSPLYQAKKGDTVYLTDLDFIYKYSITDMRTIEATAVEVIEDVENATILTLITCDDDGVTRLSVTANFLEKIPIDEASKEMKKSFDLTVNNQ